MERGTVKGRYTIIRFMPDVYNGEILNVGLIGHNEDGKVYYKMISEDSNKIKSFGKNTRFNYKYIKEKIEFYLLNTYGTTGHVGSVAVASPVKSDFLDQIIEYYSDNYISFSKIRWVKSKNTDLIYDKLYSRYTGDKPLKKVEVNTKTKVADIFKENNLLGVKVKKDFKIKPFKGFNDITMKIDFIYKNGSWNYIQVVPKLDNNKNKLEFIAEMKLLFENINKEDKVKFIYDKNYEKDLIEIINYFSKDNNIEEIDFKDKYQVNELVLDIKNNAKNNIEKLLAV